MSNHARRRSPGHLPVETDNEPRRPSRLKRWIFGNRPEDPNAPVAVSALDNRPEAELLAGFLRDKGIHAIVSADDEAGLAPQLAAMRRVRVLVKRADADRACQLIDETN